MKKRYFWSAVLLALAVGAYAATGTEDDQKFQYKLKLQNGQKYYLTMITQEKTSYTLLGKERYVEQEVGFGYELDVNQIDEKNVADVSVRLDWIMLKTKGQGPTVVYDSNQLFSPIAPAAKRLALMLGARFEVNITTEGNIKDVKKIKEMLTNIEKKLTPTMQERMLILSLKEQFTEYAIKGIFERHLAVYPENEVGVGDYWEKTFQAPLGLPLIIQNKWTLIERKNGIAIIQNNANIKTDPDAKPWVRGGTKTRYKLEGLQNGLSEAQEKTGLIRESKLSQQLTGEMKVETAGEETTEQLIPMKVQNIITFQMVVRK